LLDIPTDPAGPQKDPGWTVPTPLPPLSLLLVAAAVAIFVAARVVVARKGAARPWLESSSGFGRSSGVPCGVVASGTRVVVVSGVVVVVAAVGDAVDVGIARGVLEEELSAVGTTSEEPHAGAAARNRSRPAALIVRWTRAPLNTRDYPIRPMIEVADHVEGGRARVTGCRRTIAVGNSGTHRARAELARPLVEAIRRRRDSPVTRC
jgi:hypothetical protein